MCTAPISIALHCSPLLSTAPHYSPLLSTALHCLLSSSTTGTEHYGFTFTVQEGIDAISDVIFHLETYDVTTIRAGTPLFLLARKIKVRRADPPSNREILIAPTPIPRGTTPLVPPPLTPTWTYFFRPLTPPTLNHNRPWVSRWS